MLDPSEIACLQKYHSKSIENGNSVMTAIISAVLDQENRISQLERKNP